MVFMEEATSTARVGTLDFTIEPVGSRTQDQPTRAELLAEWLLDEWQKEHQEVCS